MARLARLRGWQSCSGEQIAYEQGQQTRGTAEMKGKNKDRVRRSPRYPFVDLGKAITQAGQLWAAIGSKETSVVDAWKIWGFGRKSSGGVQTEAALKQFGLLDVVGRGKSRRLMLSQVGQRIVDSGVAPVERSDLIQKAALRPKIHRELWDRWRTSLPVGEVRAYLIQNREFQERGPRRSSRNIKKHCPFSTRSHRITPLRGPAMCSSKSLAMPRLTKVLARSRSLRCFQVQKISSTSVSRVSGSSCQHALTGRALLTS